MYKYKIGLEAWLTPYTPVKTQWLYSRSTSLDSDVRVT